MHPKAAAAAASRTIWTAIQAATGILTAPAITDALDLPNSLKPAVTIITASLLAALKAVIASRVGNPTTVDFDTPPEGHDH